MFDPSLNLLRGGQGGANLAQLFTQQGRAIDARNNQEFNQNLQTQQNILRLGKFVADQEEKRLRRIRNEEEDERKRILFEQQQEDRTSLINAGFGPVGQARQKAALNNARLGQIGASREASLLRARSSQTNADARLLGAETRRQSEDNKRFQLEQEEADRIATLEAGTSVDSLSPLPTFNSQTGELVGANNTLLPSLNNPLDFRSADELIDDPNGSGLPGGSGDPLSTEQPPVLVNGLPSIPRGLSDNSGFGVPGSPETQSGLGLLSLEDLEVEKDQAEQAQKIARTPQERSSAVRVESRINQELERRKPTSTRSSRGSASDPDGNGFTKSQELDARINAEQALTKVEQLQRDRLAETDADKLADIDKKLDTAISSLSKAAARARGVGVDIQDLERRAQGLGPTSTAPAASPSQANADSFLSNLNL